MIAVRTAALLILLGLLRPAGVGAATKADYRALAREILAELVAIDTSTRGVNTTPAVQAIVARLRAAGYAPDEMQAGGIDAANHNLVVTLRASGSTPPIVLLAHLDVVPAHREDWSVAPFELTEQDGWFYGRGTRDNKAGVATLVTNLVRWRREGFRPDRDIIAVFTAFEEQGGAGGMPWVLERHPELRGADLCLNTDSGKGLLENGRPVFMALQAAEKVFQSFRLELTHPGGHSSVPLPDNPIYRLASALTRLSAHRFPTRLTPVTRAFFERSADREQGQVAADMAAMGRDPLDERAAERLSAIPTYNAMLRTTCVATQVNAGHAENALPQRVTATVNCRIMPGEEPEAVQQTLRSILDDPAISITPMDTAKLSEASPLRPGVVGVIERMARERWGIPVVPVMETGSTDGVYLRQVGVPTYGISALFDPPGEFRAHGRDERVHVESFYEGVEFWDEMVRIFAKGALAGPLRGTRPTDPLRGSRPADPRVQ